MASAIEEFLSELTNGELDWRADAACRDYERRHVFFPGRGGLTQSDVHEARAVCAGCPVKAECLDYALRHHERLGVWGGTTEKQRRPLMRLRRDEAGAA